MPHYSRPFPSPVFLPLLLHRPKKSIFSPSERACMLWFFAVASSAAAAPLAVVDSPTVPAYSSNLTNTTAKTSTAETNTAADAPLAEASDGRQRPWWERLSEKHRELHKGQSWCVVGSTHTRVPAAEPVGHKHSSALCHYRLQQHRVTLEASRGGAHARFATLAPQTLSEPMAAAHRACEACLLRSVRHQTMLHVAPCATLTGHLFPFAGCCAMRHPLRGGQPQWPHTRRRILAQCALTVTPPFRRRVSVLPACDLMRHCVSEGCYL